MRYVSIEELKQTAASEQRRSAVRAQIDTAVERQTRDQKPYIEFLLRDLTSSFVLRVWNDHPFYPAARELRDGSFVEIEGEFSINSAYGLEAKNWTMRHLTTEEQNDLLAGPSEVREKQELDSANLLIPFETHAYALYAGCSSTSLEIASGEQPARGTIIMLDVADWSNTLLK